MPQLETLAILATECTELPDTIGDLANLITLVLAGNTRVTHLPESLGNLRRLEQLDLSDCKNLQALPNLGKLQQLQKLDLTGCTGLRELPASLSQLPAQCEVLVPCRLQAQLSRLRPPRQRAAQPVGPGGEAARPVFRPGRPPRPPHRPRQVANPQVIWKQRLAPFAREDGAKRFSQWMDAAYQRSQDRSNQDRDIEIEKMGQIVEAASQSSSFRGKLFRFADENLRVERDRETGNTAVGIQPQAFRGEGSAYALLQEHRISDVAGTSTGEARAILGNDLRAILQRGRVPPGLSLAPYFLARNPGPLLAAYIRHRDPQGSDLMDQSAKLAEKLLEAGASNDISEQDARNGKEDAKKALDMLLQDRYREVAEEVLSETRGRHPAHRRPRP